MIDHPGLASTHATRRRGSTARIAIGALCVASFAVVVGGCSANPVPAGVPGVGRDANDVYRDIKAAGFPVTDGHPTGQFRDIATNNACDSSRTFVRTDSNVGWAMICVRPPRSTFNRISHAFDDVPMIAGPLYLDDDDGKVVIFGFGWPAKTSKQFADAIGADGSYLTTKP